MNTLTLKKLLDKRKSTHLLKKFLETAPEVRACWVVDTRGKSFIGYPDKAAEDFRDLVKNIAASGNAVTASHPYAGSPIIINEDLAGVVVAQNHRKASSQEFLQALQYLSMTLTQFALLGIEKREILDDALDKYREITLLYTVGETMSACLDMDHIAQQTLKISRNLIETQNCSVMLLNPETRKLEIKAASGAEHTMKTHLQEGIGIAGLVFQTGKPEIVNDTQEDPRFVQKTGDIRSLLCVPLKVQEKTLGVINVSNKLTGEMFTAGDEKLLMTLASQAAVCMVNAQNYEKIKRKNIAFERFVPKEFLGCLGKKEIEDIDLGEVSKEELSVLFSDIRSFTTLSESMTPEENFRFLNSYLSYIGPIIEHQGGFIDKYIGDAIMALFAGNNVGVADDPVIAAIHMLETVKVYNIYRQKVGYRPVAIGIGIHTGPLMLGTIGFEKRMDSTVIGDTVNLASRIEGLTKKYGISIVITATTLQGLVDPASFLIREIDTVQVKGKENAITVYEVFDSDPDQLKEKKLEFLSQYNEALSLYKERQWHDALQLFIELQASMGADKIPGIYVDRCQTLQDYPPDASWNGVMRLLEK